MYNQNRPNCILLEILFYRDIFRNKVSLENVLNIQYTVRHFVVSQRSRLLVCHSIIIFVFCN